MLCLWNKFHEHPLMKDAPKRLYSLNFTKVVLFLTYSDIVILSAWGLINPFIPIFVSNEINGGSIAIAGLGTTIFLLFRSIFQMPIAGILDRRKGEIDDYKYLVFGSILVAWSAFLFAFSTEVWHTLIIQAISGFALAVTYPPFNAIFTRHLKAGQIAMGWGFYDTVVGIGTALAAGLGGLMIQYFNFRIIFVIVAFFSLLGTLFIVATKPWLYKKEPKVVR